MKNFDFRIYTKRNDIKNNMCVVKDFYGDEIICEHEYRFKFSEVELMQFTGLKDCKGVKIYEGDIIEFALSLFESVKGSVEFDYGAFYLKTNDEKYSNVLLANMNFDLVEVIGNIYQHKDLLK